MSAPLTINSLLHKTLSIITDQEQRYQGKLYSFDSGKRTITLQNGE